MSHINFRFGVLLCVQIVIFTQVWCCWCIGYQYFSGLTYSLCFFTPPVLSSLSSIKRGRAVHGFRRRGGVHVFPGRVLGLSGRPPVRLQRDYVGGRSYSRGGNTGRVQRRHQRRSERTGAAMQHASLHSHNVTSLLVEVHPLNQLCVRTW